MARFLEWAWGRGVYYTIAVLSPLFLLGMYLLFSVDMPYLDQWEFVPFLEKSLTGTLTVQDFWAQHNEHRLIFPRIIMLALARLTHWDIRCELAVNFLLGAAIFLLLAAQVRVTAHSSGLPSAHRLLPVISVLAFSLSQWQNWFLGWQLQEFLNLFAVVGAVLMLSRPELRRRHVLGAAALGIVATFSFANGILVWGVGIVMLLIVQPAPHIRRTRVTAVWLAAALSVITVYLYGYRTPTYHPPMSAVWAHLLDYPVYVFVYLGQPVINWSLPGAAGAGAIGLACWAGLLAWLYAGRRIPAQLLAPYLGLGLYSVGSAAVTGVARVGFGTAQALSSRYVTMANPLWVAVMVLAWLAWASRSESAGRAAPRGIHIVAIVSTLLLIAASLYGAYRWTERCHAYRAARVELLTGSDLELLRRFHPEVPVILERREILRRYGLSIFRE